ncbi:hypothetical protein [Paenibacillus sp. OV219]|uniref:hypothetical protein n=1 Tax=Paenibacillus sp. OV219 TaxID=1884377 RepID=UPI0008BB0E0E|nr:hypothetical protein [Paenibacillus sp. OV219]SEO38061.1 hypothetical protein SAMN05518847_107245 [Paenibacillus sp. OV219]
MKRQLTYDSFMKWNLIISISIGVLFIAKSYFSGDIQTAMDSEGVTEASGVITVLFLIPIILVFSGASCCAIFFLLLRLMRLIIKAIRFKHNSESGEAHTYHGGLPIHEQLKTLRSIGIHLKQDIQLEDCFQDEHRAYESRPYLLLLKDLGSEIESEDGTFISASNNVWCFDRECIEDHGDYIRLLERIRDMVQSELSIEHIADYVDLEKDEANISFIVNGVAHNYELRVNKDWADLQILAIFTRLLAEHGSKKRFCFSDLGNDVLVVLIDRERFGDLRKLLDIFIPIG